jgi:ELWxxDGT repeat protein
VNGKLIMPATDYRGKQLWVSDGTDATTSFLKLVGPRGTASMYGFTAAGNKAFFLTQSTAANYHDPQDTGLWVTDGTSGGTQQLLVGRNPDIWNLSNPVALGDELYFNVTDLNNSVSLWKSDGTAAGTVKVIDGGNHPVPFDGQIFCDGPLAVSPDGSTRSLDTGGYLAHAAVVGGELYFIKSKLIFDQRGNPLQITDELWKTDGTVAGTQLVLSPFAPYSAGNGDYKLTGIGNELYFFVNGAIDKTDGTPGQETQVAVPGSTGASATDVAVAGGKLYFVMESNLWVTDGTAAGTRALKPGVAPGTPFEVYLTPMDGSVLFRVWNGFGSSADLWETDGTVAGTRLAQGFPANINNTLAVGPIARLGDHVYFPADDGVHGTELWSFDLTGAVSGTVFNDSNNNGTLDAGDTGLAGVTVYVDANNNGQLDPGEISTTTDSSGNYTLTGVPADVTSMIRQVAPSGWRRTAPLSSAVGTSVPFNQSATGPTFGDVQVSTVTMNFEYLLTLAQHYGQQGTFATGDVTGDGQVSFDDLLLMAQNYGHALPAGTATAAATDSSSLLLKKGRYASPKRVV